MSIAVMNWVWANSPTSGNERLVLLALADACSRDDGTGCWPSAATTARKANISDRTVRRVIARLEAEGQVIVHRGGGPTGSTKSYTVVTGDRVIHSPGQNVTPDKLSGGDTGDMPPRTQPCQGTPDIAASPDPPENDKGTAATPAREVPAAGPRVGCGGTELGEFFRAARGAESGMAADRRPAQAACARGHRGAGGWLDTGWPGQIRRRQQRWHQEPGRVLAARLAPAKLPRPPASRRPPWCGECDERTRMLDFDGDSPSPCPRCKARCARLATFIGGPGTGRSPLGVQGRRHDERGAR